MMRSSDFSGDDNRLITLVHTCGVEMCVRCLSVVAEMNLHLFTLLKWEKAGLRNEQ